MTRAPRLVLQAMRGDRTARRALAHRALEPVGLRVEPLYHSLDAHRTRLIGQLGVARIVDVGANVGQYATHVRSLGYAGEIVSFEPNPAASDELRRRAAGDDRWRVETCALGPAEGEAPLRITVDGLSTSLLQPDGGADYTFMAEDTAQQVVTPVRTLDSFGLADDGVPTLVKLDVQGYEGAVLDGGPQTLARAVAVEAELSLIPLYTGQILIEDMLTRLRASAFTPVTLTRGFTDPETHEIVQMDGLWVRRSPTQVRPVG
ncbi:MAG: FkbM family methyltransferase [Dermatophilaceae bacterium]|nr:FkbM family methyltransferase [Dermatophilaceae bacterium]